MKTKKAIKKYVVVAIWIIMFGLFSKVSEAAGWSTGDYSSMGLPTGTILNIIKQGTMWLLGLFGFFGIIGFVVSGIMYLTSAGDETQQKKAKQQMYWSITGVVVGLAGYVAIYAIYTMLGGSSTTF